MSRQACCIAWQAAARFKNINSLSNLASVEHDTDTLSRPEIIIFRQNLFRISEPFITQQAERLRRYRAVYLGRMLYGDPPVGARAHVLGNTGSVRALLQISSQMISRNADPYLTLLKDNAPVLIHAHFGIDAVYALPIARQLDIPLVTTFHGFDATLSTAALLCSPAWANFPLFRRRLARQGNLFLCSSSFIRNRVLAMGFPETLTRVHYTGVDCEAIPIRDPSEETPTILHVARLVEMKGTRYLIHAFAGLRRRYPAARLVIIGDGPLNRSLVRLVATLGLESHVQFLGALPHARIVAWMRKAAMLVLPSIVTSSGRVEGLGMVLMEAAATGIPVIGSRVGGIPEAIIDGETGFLVPARDPESLCDRMSTLLDQPALRLDMGIRAREFVERHFNIHDQNQRLEVFYDKLVNETR